MRSVSFDASTSTDPNGDALSYSWQFGDGTSATGAVVRHTYLTAGRFTATVTVDDGQTTDTTQTTNSSARPGPAS